MFRLRVLIALAAIAVASLLPANRLLSQGTPPAPPAKADTLTLGTVKITAARPDETHVTVLERLTLPATIGITASKVAQSVNMLDPEDAVKYLPSIFIRKRNYGDTQATLGTRVWGVSSSARSLIFADDVPITALIANNNTLGGPRWGLIAPEAIARIDVMYGPFSAAYAGNSMGAVMEITTRQPDSLQVSIEQTQALQHFSLYGTNRTFGTRQSNGIVGDKFGNLSFWLSGNYQDSRSQPLTYVTAGSAPAGTSGSYPGLSKLGAPSNVLGASGLLHTGMTNATGKVAYDVTPWLRAAYTFGYWKNDADANVDTYLGKSGSPTFASQAGFASGMYELLEEHSSHSLSLRTDTRRDWDVEAVGTVYRFNKDQQRTPGSIAGDTTSEAGRVAALDGTGWATLDLKAAWHPGGPVAANTLSFGAHADHYRLFNPTYNTPDWRGGDFTTVASEGDGKTETRALWAQDAWMIQPTLRLTLGGRYESWHAFDGFNANDASIVNQPDVNSTKFSPKASLVWDATDDWQLTGSLAKAYRFATPAELYQLITTGTTFTSPDPNLKPDNDLASELRILRRFDRATAQLSLFEDDVHDAIIAQYLPLGANSSTLYSYVSNVDHVRARGAELVLGGTDMFVHNLDLSASATYVDARTLALSGRASANAPPGSAVGKFLPGIPKWRASIQGTYHPTQPLALSLAGRYSTKMFTTLDNSDVQFNTYQGFSEWFTMDARANYRVNPNWTASLGIDNLLNRKYFLFHPFPQRTLVGSLKFSR